MVARSAHRAAAGGHFECFQFGTRTELRLLSKYLAVNPNEMDWHCGEQSLKDEY